uniref:Uncharacterized protein n=1 Tax=Panagrolaimus sp. JU765 TaxID=591449 RepID=A0AC34PZC3_9BILA
MRSTLVGVVFICLLVHVFAGGEKENELKNYGTTSTDARRLLTYRFANLIGKEYERHDKSFDNETANKTTSKASESEMVSFIDSSTQVGINGTKKVNELEHVADEMLNATMEDVQGIKMDDLEENSTQIEKNGNESTQLIDLKHDGDELVKKAMENVTETKENNSEDLTQFEPSFLAQNEKSSEKYVKVENKVLEFLNDATVNVTVENNQLTLFVKDDTITFGEQTLYVCFKSTIQSYVSSTCPSEFCEVRIRVSSDGEKNSTYIDFDGHNQTFGVNSITVMITENSMKVTSVPGSPSSITTCNPDFDAGYLPVKVINKGDKIVRLSNVELHKSEEHEMETDMTPATIAGIAVGGFAILVILIVAVAVICSKNSEKPNQNQNKNPEVKAASKTKALKDEDEPKKEQKLDIVPK